MSVADTFMSKLYFKKSYFCEELFVVEAFDQFRYPRNKNQQNVYRGGFFIYWSCFFRAPQIQVGY